MGVKYPGKKRYVTLVRPRNRSVLSPESLQMKRVKTWTTRIRKDPCRPFRPRGGVDCIGSSVYRSMSRCLSRYQTAGSRAGRTGSSSLL